LESSAAVIAAQQILLSASVILIAGVAASVIARLLRIPDIVIYLLAGIALGPAAAGVIDVPASSTMNQLILVFGASFILFDGGAVVSLRVIRKIWPTVLALSVAGVLITAGVTGLAAHWLLGLPFAAALLLGAVIAPTDPATLIPVFKQVAIRERLTQLAIAESAFNDAVGASLVFALVGFSQGTGVGVGEALFSFAWQAVVGIAAGAALGWAACLIIARTHEGFLAEYLPLATLIVVTGAYLGASHLQASGFMGVFVAGLVIGNKGALGFATEARARVEDFIDTTSLIMRMFIFILLGSQVDVPLLARFWLPGLGIAAVFMFIARPLAVFCCAAPDRRAQWSLQELLFLSWTRETGVIPGALAGILIGMKVPRAEEIAALTFIAILTTILLQATTARAVARRLNVLETA
jgi:cell volume regulation protein A